MQLRYGTNPHQAARIGPDSLPGPLRVRNGTPSYINLLDALNAWQLVREAASAFDRPVATSPSGERTSVVVVLDVAAQGTGIVPSRSWQFVLDRHSRPYNKYPGERITYLFLTAGEGPRAGLTGARRPAPALPDVRHGCGNGPAPESQPRVKAPGSAAG